MENDDIPPIPTPNMMIFLPSPPQTQKVCPTRTALLGSSNIQPHSTHGEETGKIMYTPANTSPSCIKWDLSGLKRIDLLTW